MTKIFYKVIKGGINFVHCTVKKITVSNFNKILIVVIDPCTKNKYVQIVFSQGNCAYCKIRG